MAFRCTCDPPRAAAAAAAAPTTRYRVLVAAVTAAVAAAATVPAPADGCFPGHATAQLPSGVMVRLDALPDGAEVRVSASRWAPLLGMNTTRGGSGGSSGGGGGGGAVHDRGGDKDDGGSGKPTGRLLPPTTYVRLTTASAELDLTPAHLVPVYGRAGEPPVTLREGRPTAVPAGVVGVGDRLAVVAATSAATGRRAPAVEAVTTVSLVVAPAGRYAPVTAAGTVVVGGVVVTAVTGTGGGEGGGGESPPLPSPRGQARDERDSPGGGQRPASRLPNVVVKWGVAAGGGGALWRRLLPVALVRDGDGGTMVGEGGEED